MFDLDHFRYYVGNPSAWESYDEQMSDRMRAAADEIERLQKIASAAGGYLMNAKIDLETNATKRTAIRTIEGGIKMIEAALSSGERRDD